ncbi:putative efflux pump antibiotic resistance protein [Apodospora peruviana]|uniref:Efflux pump antibiotic resistance protein n=1 Tax=Apodospora peruviana TaxID=516989 RepID=A0AAE0M773_9PEZI|nr:putative efflux pump antibiotic resistance protein [Apodospora peruviana]
MSLKPSNRTDDAGDALPDMKSGSQQKAAESDGSPVSADDGTIQPSPPVSVSASHAHLTGWRLVVTTLGLLLCLYLVNLEVTIVSTSLVSIANDLSGFDKTNWIVTGYLITYTGFIIIWTKLSDIIGRKAALTAAMVVFSAFSAGCGAAKAVDQLIVFRALQGVGAAGTYSMSILSVYDMVPREKLALNGVFISISIALATLTGPLLAGGIVLRSTWRWVFYLNVPAGALAIGLLLIGIPPGFGTSSRTEKSVNSWRTNLSRLDFVGAILLLAGSLLLVSALQQTALDLAWSSAAVIVLLVLSGLSWVSFFLWERHLTARHDAGAWPTEPIFPWRFLTANRAWVGMLLTTFCVGAPFNVAVVSLPQRFQAVSGMSVLDAGVRLIPFSVSGAFSSAVANLICSRARVPPVYFLVFGAVLNLVGNGLLSSLPTDGSTRFPGAGYAYQVITAGGVGTTFGILVLATPFMVEPRDLAVATGAIIQFRFLGGAIGVSVAGNILNSALKRDLRDVLSQEDLAALLVNIDVIGRLGAEQQHVVRGVFSQAYRTQFLGMLAFAGMQLLASLLLVKFKGRQIRAA